MEVQLIKRKLIVAVLGANNYDPSISRTVVIIVCA